ncbi:MAG: hypothetical protein QNI88_17880, partial [Desulfobacterales bacterium]|nr:hypothetical protein [Desulfobacterales bacterium]
ALVGYAVRSGSASESGLEIVALIKDLDADTDSDTDHDEGNRPEVDFHCGTMGRMEKPTD